MEIQLDPARGEVRLGRLHLDPRRMETGWESSKKNGTEMEKITEMEGHLQICYDMYIYIFIWLDIYIYILYYCRYWMTLVCLFHEACFQSFDVPRSTRLKLVRGDRQGLRGVLQEQLQAGGKNLRLPWRSLRPGDLLGDISGTSLYFIEIYGELYGIYENIWNI